MLAALNVLLADLMYSTHPCQVDQPCAAQYSVLVCVSERNLMAECPLFRLGLAQNPDGRLKCQSFHLSNPPAPIIHP